VSFEKLNLHPNILKALAESGYTAPTPIQAEAIPAAIAGRDLMASAQTGTGKTAAFVLPALQRLSTPSTKKSRGPRVLVLTPTRELANQVNDAVRKYGRYLSVRSGIVVGGMPYPTQNRLLSQPLDVLVATPGRLLDHMERGRVDFSRLEVLVLDEADRMLDMGFIGDIQAIAAATPAGRQTLLFSATLEGTVLKLAQRLLRDAQRIQMASVQARHEHIEQRLLHVDDNGHKHRLLKHILSDGGVDKVIVFTATKRDADQLAERLAADGHAAAALHGDMRQSQRNRTLEQLRRGQVGVLVATDVAARGIDVANISHVVNYSLPRAAEDYVHRIGRTGRAGASGIAISFVGRGEQRQVRDIERYTGQRIPAQVIPGFEPRQPATGSHEPRKHSGKPSYRPPQRDGNFRGKSEGRHGAAPARGQQPRTASGRPEARPAGERQPGRRREMYRTLGPLLGD
jgi:superfamily II DNA/RNA helicase